MVASEAKSTSCHCSCSLFVHSRLQCTAIKFSNNHTGSVAGLLFGAHSKDEDVKNILFLSPWLYTCSCCESNIDSNVEESSTVYRTESVFLKMPVLFCAVCKWSFVGE